MDKTTTSSPEPPALLPPPRPPGSRKKLWLNEGDLICRGPGCEKPIPAGWYGKLKSFYSCSHPCNYHYILSYRKEVTCRCGCGTKFVPTNPHTKDPFYKDHYNAWRRQQTDQKKVGRFTPLLTEFMQDCAPRQYSKSTFNALRCNLVIFFYFLNRYHIRSLESVTPRTITKFFTELATRRKCSAGAITGSVSCLFDWLRLTGRRKAANPVIVRFHGQKRPKRKPRPYSKAEMALIWSLLDANGDLQLQVAVALGCQAGLRISECARVMTSEIDLQVQQLFVPLPTKTGVERDAPFAELAKAFLEKWLQERGVLSHDRLLVGPSGKPMQAWTLRNRLNAVLCGPGKLPKFEFHRLRHVASSTMHQGGADDSSVMAAFGWRDPAVMQGYTEILDEQVRAQYDRAFSPRANSPETQTRVQSMDEFFANSDDTDTNPA